MKNAASFLSYLCVCSLATAFNGELAELECPDDCDCYYFRVNWVTDCSDSNLDTIPYEDIDRHVYILDLNDNKIGNIDKFPPGTKMRRLQMADNILTELRKESFAGLNYLIDADFSGNLISRIDPDVFRDSPGLITLELQRNPLAQVEGPFLVLKSLLHLDISYCNITSMDPLFLSELTSLGELDLSGNPLKSLTQNIFDPVPSLEILKLNNCSLEYVSEKVFRPLENLKHLELKRNNIMKTEWISLFSHLVRLEHLDLGKSGITYIAEDTFKENPYLRTLILADNALHDVDVASSLGFLQELDYLDLSHCNLTLPLSEDAFSNATKLRSLLLSGNALFASDLLVALAPLSNLQKLSLSHCGLSKLPDTLDKFKSLQELDISHNPLNDVFIKLLAPLKTLEYLNMGYSNLSKIAPTTFSKMTSMKRLILSGNDIHYFEAGLFGNLTQLESLELNFCGLHRPLNATVFFGNFTYTDLVELQLAGNPLQVSPRGPLLPKQFSRLLSLDLSNCNLTFLTADAFYWSRNITTLILRGNHFGPGTDFAFLELLPNLEHLDLRYNDLVSFSPKEIHLNPLINKLKLIGNPWLCDCSVAVLWDWASLEKGDLSILEGSIATAENIKAGKSKGKKLLVCNYDGRKLPLAIYTNKTVSARRSFKNPQRVLTAANRTWAKYVQESNCEQTVNLSRVSRAAESFSESHSRLGPNDWAMAAVHATIVYGTIMTILGTVILFRKYNFQRLLMKTKLPSQNK